jgi:peroxiredoxin
MALKVGDKAPLFDTFNSEKEPFSLDKQKGEPILLLFFPAAFTRTCTKELCSVRDELAWYNKLNCSVAALATDSVYSLAKYKEEQKLNFQLLSDFNKDICAKYDSQYETFGYGMKGVAKRSAFLIDKNGILQYVEVLDNASEVPDFEKIKAALQTLK